MKRSLGVALATVLALSVLLTACGETQSPSASSAAPSQEPASSTQSVSSEAALSSAPAVSTPSSAPASSQASANRYAFSRTSLVLPEGFSVQTVNNVPVACPANYPTDADNIAFTSDVADDINAYSKETLDGIYQNLFAGFESLSFEKTTVGGVPAIVYAYRVGNGGLRMVQKQYVLFTGTSTDIVTFTSVTGKYDDAFQACAQTISVSK